LAARAYETAFQVFFTFRFSFSKKPAKFVTIVRGERVVALYGNHTLGRGSEKKNHVLYLRFTIYDLRSKLLHGVEDRLLSLFLAVQR
jgi:hypothetical protein